MKHTSNQMTKGILLTLIALLLSVTMLAGCTLDFSQPFLGLLSPDASEEGLGGGESRHPDALYTEDTELGRGQTTVLFRATADDLSVLFTIHTDKTMLGDALVELGLVEGEASAYGLYVKRVNGILADYNVDGSWWSLYIDDEMAMSGVDTTEISVGAVYEFKKEK